MIEFYKRNISHLDNLSLFFNLEQKYSSIYHCALHKNQFYKPCLPYVFAYKEDILPSLAFYSILWQSEFYIDYYQNSIIVPSLMSIIIDYLVIFPDDQFHQVNLPSMIWPFIFTRSYWRTGRSSVDVLCPKKKYPTPKIPNTQNTQNFHTPDMSDAPKIPINTVHFRKYYII